MRFLAPFLTALLVACTNGSGTGPDTTIRITPPGEVDLLEGQSVEVALPSAPSPLVVTFARIASDSRCPSNVQCVWAGEVTVVLTLSGIGSGEMTLNLPGTGTKPATGTAGPYRLELKDVSPYPVSGSPSQEPNRVTLGVSLQP